ncbi:hypothetical protein R3P38DRAFT_2794023 [Favolaschia claudopus]|uniref:Uncharacterized protein n=1 Tax=Favolaschia claudopus TaxID=2862362 RepID=A0AAW0ABS8_9AGAR
MSSIQAVHVRRSPPDQTPSPSTGSIATGNHASDTPMHTSRSTRSAFAANPANGETIHGHDNRPPPAILAHSHPAKQGHEESRRSRVVYPGTHPGVSAGRKVTVAWAGKESRLLGEGTATAAKRAADGIDGIEDVGREESRARERGGESAQAPDGRKVGGVSRPSERPPCKVFIKIPV